MAVLSDLKQRRHQLGSSRSIRSLLERRWWVVVLALMLTGLGAAMTGVLFKAGIKLLGGWRLDLMAEYPAWMVLPCLGAIGGLVSGLLVSPTCTGGRRFGHHPHHGLFETPVGADGPAGGPGETGGRHHGHWQRFPAWSRKALPCRWVVPWPGRWPAG